jgi:hypothetical protein
LDRGLLANPARRFSTMFSVVAVPVTDQSDGHVPPHHCRDKDDRTLGSLGLPGDRVRVIGLLPTFFYSRWYENIFQPVS